MIRRPPRSTHNATRFPDQTLFRSRSAILKDGQLIDGRNTKQIRPIEAIVGFLPRTHGSALFTRGETQAICTTTLGTKDAEQMIDGLTGLSYERFMLHYNFPPY